MSSATWKALKDPVAMSVLVCAAAFIGAAPSKLCSDLVLEETSL